MNEAIHIALFFLIANSSKCRKLTNIPDTSNTSKIVGKMLNTNALKIKLIPLLVQLQKTFMISLKTSRDSTLNCIEKALGPCFSVYASRLFFFHHQEPAHKVLPTVVINNSKRSTNLELHLDLKVVLLKWNLHEWSSTFNKTQQCSVKPFKKSHSAVLSCDTVYNTVRCGSNFLVCGSNIVQGSSCG